MLGKNDSILLYSNVHCRIDITITIPSAHKYIELSTIYI